MPDDDRIFTEGSPPEFSAENLRDMAKVPVAPVFADPTEGIFIGFDEENRPSLDDIFASFGRLGGPSQAGWHSWEEAMRCPRADYLARRDWMKLSGPALEIGSILHEFLAVHYLKRSCGEDPSQRIEEMSAKLIEHRYSESYNVARRLFDLYLAKYPHEEDEFLNHYRVVDVEREFQRDLPWGGLYTARADLVLKGPSGYVVVDHKTSSREDTDFLEGWVLDPQMMGLAWCVNKTLRPVVGYMINGIVKRKDPGYRRLFFSVDPRLIRDWLSMMKYWTMQRQLADMAGHPPNFSLCIRRYGRCQFFERCAYGLRRGEKF